MQFRGKFGLFLFVGAANSWCPPTITGEGEGALILSRRHPTTLSARTDNELSSQQEQQESIYSKYHTLPRLYVEDTVLAKGKNFTLSPEQAHYVTKVMRIGTKKSRDSVRVFNGVHGEWLAQIILEMNYVGPRKRRPRSDELLDMTARCTLELRPQEQSPAEQPWLFFAPIKKQRMKLLLEKCTELGVGRFVPILTERTEPNSVLDVMRNIGKLRAQTVEASEQCERLTVPPLSLCLSNDETEEDIWDFSTLLNKWSTCDAFREKHLLICRERTANGCVPVLELLEQFCTIENLTVAFVVGPEGGWSPTEEALCDQYTSSCSNINSVSLGSLVLRAETAAIAAVSACMLCQDAQNNQNDRIEDA